MFMNLYSGNTDYNSFPQRLVRIIKGFASCRNIQEIVLLSEDRRKSTEHNYFKKLPCGPSLFIYYKINMFISSAKCHLKPNSGEKVWNWLNKNSGSKSSKHCLRERPLELLWSGLGHRAPGNGAWWERKLLKVGVGGWAVALKANFSSQFSHGSVLSK